MNYRILPPGLHAIADAATSYFRETMGATSFRVEEALAPDIAWRPTLCADLVDKYQLCVEVTDREISPAVANGIMECVQRQLPIKLYVAMPADGVAEGFRANCGHARKHGLGIVQVNGEACQSHCDATSLSLWGLRAVSLKEFPPFMREALNRAVASFRGGNPVKGCSELYDEIERYSRQVCAETQRKGFWKAAPTGKKWPTNLEKGDWAPILQAFMAYYDSGKAKSVCPGLKPALIAGLVAITPHRNEAGHKPKTFDERNRRDRELKTRFEHATDLLRELVESTKGLKIKY